MENNNGMKGFKVFNSDWTCLGFKYEVGNTYEMNEKPVICKRGFHFCINLSDCFNYYKFDPKNKVAEILAIGDIDERKDKYNTKYDTKCCTNKIKIINELTWEEVLLSCNAGSYNAGCCNTGHCNTGSRNTGSYNAGSYNAGCCNTGHCNTGNYNTGDYNTGNYNTGSCNTGDYNTGSCNTGNFMTKEQKIYMFNKPTNWYRYEWKNSYAYEILIRYPREIVEWVCDYNMSDQEKIDYPEYKTTGGYLKILEQSEKGLAWWDSLNISEKTAITNLPNFDAKIFEECTGIRVEEE